MTNASLTALLLMMLLSRGRAQSACTTALLSLTPCLNYVTGSSATPSPSCCSQLGNVVKSDPRCLCSLLNGGGSSLGVSINQTLALSLPDQCKVQTPPISQCNSVAEGPAGGLADVPSSGTSPVSSPIPNEPEPPTTATSPVSSPITNEPEPPTPASVAPVPSERAVSGPSAATSPTADEPETTNTQSVPPISSGTTSKTVPATKGSTSGGTVITRSLNISMIALFLSAFASMVINA